ncbi:CHASE3 domain-containing protein [Niastella sp. OAS944]|uniref:sensor histidine kinase n=1 Tax=Niastella sp. OAS944 TaxID=2664089 RepID=UPI0035C78DF0|nr:signal transduction histidine kinase [Chitinophagaceae bacterium OAS944]
MKKRLFFIITAFVLSLIITLFLSYLLYESYIRSTAQNRRIEHAYKVVLQTSALEKFIKEAETGQRGYLLTNDSSFLKPYLDIRSDIKPGYDSLRRLTSDNGHQQQLLNKAGLLMNKLIDHFQHSVYLKSRGSLLETRGYMDELRKVFKEIEQDEMDLVKSYSVNTYEASMPRYFSAIFLFAAVIIFISFLVILKEYRQRMQYQKQLEQKVLEVNAYNVELEQIAFATSHDLQEPLRRIRTFSDRLLWKYRDQLNDDGQMILSRIDYSARRMQGLLEDLMNFVNLVRGGEQLSVVDANKLMTSAVEYLKQEIEIKRATIHIGQLPEITGFEKQLFLMFKSLIDNAIKFSKPGIPPVVTIQCVQTTGDELVHIDKKLSKKQFIRISVQDNGIGFSNEFSQKIFLIFQRLHAGAEYEGKGIGLAIVERVMTNHNGYVLASAQIDKGALFNLYFPVPEA